MQSNNFLFALFAAIAVILTVVSAAPSADVKKARANRMIKRSNSYTGTATWFSPEKNGGNYGACWGEWIDDDSEIVALNGDQYGDMDGNSKWCGKRVQINGPHGTVTAKIMDACPGCGWGDLDLTPTLFKRVVGDLDKGVGEIKWKVL